ncbi:MAG: WbqC family protein [Bacteroidota bacterium]
MSDKNEILLSTAYLGPVLYFAQMLKYKNVLIEQHETYPKQTYRNRCIIYGANGPVVLTIPVKKPHGSKTKTKDILLDYDTSWAKNHWRTIFSAYNSSPFFEYFKDDLAPFYQKKFKYLLAFNLSLQNTLLESIQMNINIELTRDFITENHHLNDFRYLIHPKKDNGFNKIYKKPVQYTQVFSEKHGFISNLSIIDLIFNEGPNTLNILKQVINTK